MPIQGGAFCGMHDHVNDKPNHKRNPWTYKIGLTTKAPRNGNTLWKQRNVRNFRTSVRKALVHGDYDYVALHRHRHHWDSWTSPHDSDRTSRRFVIHPLDLNFFGRQTDVLERNAIHSFKHGLRKMRSDFPDDDEPSDQERFKTKQKQEQSERINHRQLKRAELQECIWSVDDMYPFIDRLFEQETQYDNQNEHELSLDVLFS